MMRLLNKTVFSFASATEATIELVSAILSREKPATTNSQKTPFLYLPKSREISYSNTSESCRSWEKCK